MKRLGTGSHSSSPRPANVFGYLPRGTKAAGGCDGAEQLPQDRDVVLAYPGGPRGSHAFPEVEVEAGGESEPPSEQSSGVHLASAWATQPGRVSPSRASQLLAWPKPLSLRPFVTKVQT